MSKKVRRGATKPSKQARECLHEEAERKMCLGRKGVNRQYRGMMLAEKEKEVMMVSFLCCELSLTLLD